MDPDPDSDPDPALFVIDLQEANKKQFFNLQEANKKLFFYKVFLLITV
jgi:hypothetical protein